MNVEIRRHQPDRPWTYAALDRRQREIAERIHQGGAGAILLSEVAPVVTVGRRTAPGDVELASLSARGIECYEADRGGFATYHGPGQWVVFVVESLERLTGDRKGVRKAVCQLLDLARLVCAHYDPSAKVGEGAELGVWGKNGKLAALGIHIADGVILHGIAINAFRTPQSFAGIRPCGLDAPVGFLFESGTASAGPLEIDETEELFSELGDRIATIARQSVASSRAMRASCLSVGEPESEKP